MKLCGNTFRRLRKVPQSSAKYAALNFARGALLGSAAELKHNLAVVGEVKTANIEKLAGNKAGDDAIPAADLYAEYRDWMTSNNYRALSAGNFYKRVCSIIPTAVYKLVRLNVGPVKSICGIQKRFTL